jgi:hypothetical protein
MKRPDYDADLAVGLKFEDFVYEQLKVRLGITLERPRWDGKTQRELGENPAGWEICEE